jgi:hypothetical protein
VAGRERGVSRLTRDNGREHLLTETFTDEGERSGSRPAINTLTQRVSRTTIPRADGGRDIVEEVEERSSVAPADAPRVVRRTVETVRPAGAGRWRTARQVFERDANNRLVPTISETDETAER